MGDPGRRQAAARAGDVRSGAMGDLDGTHRSHARSPAEGWIVEMVHASARREFRRQRDVLRDVAGAPSTAFAVG